jgi:hypothetical protein
MTCQALPPVQKLEVVYSESQKEKRQATEITTETGLELELPEYSAWMSDHLFLNGVLLPKVKHERL